MSEEGSIRFGRYVLHPTQGLMRGRQEVRITAKSLAVLRALADRAGHVVTKAELFETVWPGTAVSDAALTSCIKELRQALHDDARSPRYIETLHRRGYRFISASGDAPTSALHAPHIERSAPESPLPGRAAILDEMRATLLRASGGDRQFLFITGEAGIGKSTLVERFVARATSAGGVRVALGQCVEHHGRGEAYQPLLEALTRLARSAGGGDVVVALGRHAPTWLPQLPSLQPRPPTSVPPPMTTPERMVRELADAADALTTRLPLILWLEDLHWADASTLDWIAAAAHRRDKARLLVIATCRPAEGSVPGHSVGTLVDALRLKGLCREIALPGLDEHAVRDVVATRFPPAGGASLDHLARIVQRHTQGNPLFAGHLLADLHARGWLVDEGTGWTVREGLGAGDLGVPEDLRRVIDRDIDRLEPSPRGFLEAASVAGVGFSAAAVAAAAGAPVADVESVLGTLARRQQFVREAGVAEWPDGTIAARFEFLHALHRDVLYQRVTAGTRAVLHKALAAAQEKAFGSEAREIAAELADHFERGHDHARAILHRRAAADTARRRSAYRESQMHLEHALALLERQAEGPQRIETEIALRIDLGSVLQVVRGWGAREVEEAFARAHALSQSIGDTPRLFPALWGLWLFYWGRGTLSLAGGIAEQLQALAQQTEDAALRLQAHHASWATLFSLGRLSDAHAHAVRGIALYQAARHAPLAATYGNHDAGVCSRSFSARALMLMGRPDESIRMSEEAVTEARALGHPVTLCLSLIFAAAVHQLRRNAAAAGDCATAAAGIARDHGLRLLLAWSSVFEGWALVHQEQPEQGTARIREGLSAARATGSEQFLPHLDGLLAEAALTAGDVDAGFEAVAVALGGVKRTGERVYEAELHRINGELVLRRSRDEAAVREAETAFTTALGIAHEQGAALLGLRAAVSLARLHRSTGQDLDAREIVSAACARMTDGQALPDMRDARALLESGARGGPP